MARMSSAGLSIGAGKAHHALLNIQPLAVGAVLAAKGSDGAQSGAGSLSELPLSASVPRIRVSMPLP